MRLRNEEHNILTVTPYNVARQLYTVYQQGISTATWNAETALQAIAHSTLQFIPSNEQGCLTALDYLNNKLEAVRKTISFWDAYQITDVIEDSEVVLNKISQLPNNSSLVNNSPTEFQWLDPNTNVEETVYKGDVFVKDYLGNIHLVHATNKGIYVPAEISLAGAGNSLTIKYEYKSSGKSEVTLSLDSTTLDLENDSGYNQRGELAPGQSADVLVKYGPDDIIITPIVKFFNDLDQVSQEIAYTGPTGSGNNRKWTITNNTKITVKYEVR